MKISTTEAKIKGSRDRDITLDITIPQSKTPRPLLIYCHGFKGFKDWGHLNWVATKAAEAGLAFLKFNFSYNGTDPDSPKDITELQAFSENNYSTEVADLGKVIDFATEQAAALNIDPENINLLGHSRGGGIALLRASEDKRVKKLVLWASVSEFDSFFRPETVKEWEETGVVSVLNKRTGVEMPLKKQFYDDYQTHRSRLDVRKAAGLLSIPLLILHGDADSSVPVSHAEALYQAVQHSIFIKTEGGDHTFGAKHPFDPETDVTPMLEELLENTFEFLTD